MPGLGFGIGMGRQKNYWNGYRIEVPHPKPAQLPSLCTNGGKGKEKEFNLSPIHEDEDLVVEIFLLLIQ